jgi:AraC family transcriptional regulator
MAATLTFAADAYRPGTRQPPHRHDELHLSLVLTGRVAETVGGATEHAGALSVVAKDAGVVHAVDFGAAGARMARLALPGGTVGALVDVPAPAVGCAAGWRWTHDPAVAAPFLRLVRRGRAGAAAFAADDPDLLDLLAAFTARPAPPPRGRPPAWLAGTMAELRAAWHPRLGVADVARRAGVHPVYLARCVRRWYGTGVGEELRRLRLRAAVVATVEAFGGRGTRAGGTSDGGTHAGGTLSGVAHALGFADESHYCRAVRRATGMPPGALRALVASLDYQGRGGAPRAGPSAPPAGRDG